MAENTNNLDYIYKLGADTSDFTAGMEKAAKTADSTAKKISDSLKKISSSFSGASLSSSLKDMSASVNDAVQSVNDSVSEERRRISEVYDEVKKSTAEHQKLASAVKDVATAQKEQATAAKNATSNTATEKMSAGYKLLQTEVNNTAKAVVKYNAELEKQQGMGLTQDSKKWQDLWYNVGYTTTKYYELAGVMEELSKSDLATPKEALAVIADANKKAATAASWYLDQVKESVSVQKALEEAAKAEAREKEEAAKAEAKAQEEAAKAQAKAQADAAKSAQAGKETIGQIDVDASKIAGTIKDIGESVKEAFDVSAYMQKFTDAVTTDGPISALLAIKKEITSVEKQLDRYNAKAQKQTALGVNDESSSSWRSLQYDIGVAESKLDALKSKYAELKDVGSSVAQGFDISAYIQKFADSVVKEGPVRAASVIEKEISNVEKQLDRFNAKAQKQSDIGVSEQSNSWKSLQYDIGVAASKLEALRAQYAEVNDIVLEVSNNSSAVPQMADGYRLVASEIQKTEAQLSKLLMKQDQMKAFGIPDNSRRWQELQYAIDFTKNKIYALKDEMSSVGTKDEGFAHIESATRSAADATNNLWQSMQTGADETSSHVNNIGSVLSGIGANSARAFSDSLRNIGTSLVNITKVGFSSFGRIVSTGFKNATAGARNFVSSLKSVKKESVSVDAIVKRVQKTMLSLYHLFRARVRRSFMGVVFKDVNSYMGDIAHTSARFNAAVSSIVNSAKALGAQLVAAAEPIVTVVAPYITAFIDLLTSGADKLAQFAARITGNMNYLKATKGNYDYAKSLDAAEKSTKKTTKATKEYQNTVLSFDQLHKLNGTNDTDAQVESITGVSQPAIKQAATQASAINSIADQIRNALRTGDYRGAGHGFASLVNEGFAWVKNVAGWEKNSEKVKKICKNIIDFVNGFGEGFDAVKNGEAVGDVINTIIESVKMLTDPSNGIDFSLIGRNIGTMLLNAIREINWEDAGTAFIQSIQALVRVINGIFSTEGLFTDLGKGVNSALGSAIDAIDPELWSDTFANIVNGIADFLISAFDNTDKKFGKLGEKLGTVVEKALSKIDGSKLAGAGEAIKGAFADLFLTLWDTLPVEAIGEKIKGFLQKIPWGTVLLGALTIGVIGSFPAVLTQVLAKLLATLILEVPKMLLNFATMLPNMILGLLTNPITLAVLGIGALVFGAIATHWEEFQAKLGEWGAFLSEKFEAVKTNVGDGISKIKQAIDTMKPVFDEIWEHLSPLFDSIVSFIGKAFEDLSRLWNKVLAPLIAWFIEHVIPVITPFFTTTIDNIKSLIDWASDFVTHVIDALGGLIDFVTGVFTGDWDKAWNGLIDIVKSVVNIGLDAISGFFNFFINGINGVIEMINKIPDVKTPFGQVGIPEIPTIPRVELPRLANGGIVGDGQLFIANEGRAEMIAGDGGRTAVVNNEQIVESIVRGVRDAVADVMMTMGGDDSSVNSGDIVMVVDGEELARASLRGQAKLDKRMHPQVTFA